jgi:hypothetical protein
MAPEARGTSEGYNRVRMGLRDAFSGLRNPLAGLFSRSSMEDRLAAYVIREHATGRRIEDIIDDPYLRNRASEEEIARLFDRPDIVHAVGEHVAQGLRRR